MYYDMTAELSDLLTIPVKVKRLRPDAIIPKYATEGAAGFDLHAANDVIVQPGETVLVPTGLAFEIPRGYEIQVRPRSGISLKTKLRVQLGTCDADYRGEVGVIVDNAHTGKYGIEIAEDINGEHVEQTRNNCYKGSYIIRKGDRIAQGIVAPVERAAFEVVEELTETERGADGFGSTGTRTEADG